MTDPESKSPRVTLKDVARAVGLSHAAVSLALRNSKEIAETTRYRVQAAARDMGYKPNPMATGLAHFKRSSTVKPVHAALAWLNCWPDPKKLRSFTEFDRYWKGASACAEKFGYRLEEFLCNDRMPPDRLEKVLLARGINGILLPPTSPDSPDWGDFHWERFSAVRLGRRAESPRIHTVAAAQTANAMLAYDQIRAKGYERIGYAGVPWRVWTHGAGFLWAQATDWSLKSLVPPFFHTGAAGGQKKLEAWLRKTKPDAILTDLSELPAMLAKAGYRVPEDIGLAAVTVLDCKIDAGIYQNPEEIGRVAMLVLVSLINDNDRGIPPTQREILVKGSWVDGACLPRR
jgi:DNA-binding LacI/PurR family transcriptional regulator